MQLCLRGRDALFLHVPKTGGNTVQQALLAAGCSADQLKLSGHQDGVDRFELRGPHTRSKHQDLGTYMQLWPPASHCPLALGVRAPLRRLLSLFFSPHRWLAPQPDGAYALPEQAPFDPSQFAGLVAATPSAADWLASGEPGSAEAADLSELLCSGRVQLLRTHQLAADFERAFGFELLTTPRNVSPFREQARKLAADPHLQAMVQASHHRLDWLLLERA